MLLKHCNTYCNVIDTVWHIDIWLVAFYNHWNSSTTFANTPEVKKFQDLESLASPEYFIASNSCWSFFFSSLSLIICFSLSFFNCSKCWVVAPWFSNRKTTSCINKKYQFYNFYCTCLLIVKLLWCSFNVFLSLFSVITHICHIPWIGHNQWNF